MNPFRNSTIAVIGYGVEGQSVVRWLLAHGSTSITVYDGLRTSAVIGEPVQVLAQHSIPFIHGPFPDELPGVDVIIYSPGIRPDVPLLQNARKNGITVTTGTNIFMDLAPCPMIGVTGTKGKGTTSALITEMIKNNGGDAYLGGNIGTPPLDFLDSLTKDSYVVLEMSSFQLFSATKSPNIAVILMVTSEHLDYHKDTQEYVMAKRGIVKYQSLDDITVVNMDYPNSVEVASVSASEPVMVSIREELLEGCFVKDGSIVWKKNGIEERIIDVVDIFIPGRHNWENAIAASAVAKLLKIPTFTINQTLKTFRGLPHRIEFVAAVKGVRFYDDSFSTTPETAIAALEAFREPKVMILGGSSKNSDFRDLGKSISNSTSLRGIVGIGVEWERIKKECRIQNPDCTVIEGCKTMNEIVKAAQGIAKAGDVVVLSPACASFDMFKNYKDRGEKFKEQVRRISE